MNNEKSDQMSGGGKIKKWRRRSKSRAVRDQTHLRENKREEVKLYHVINSREEKKKKNGP